MSTNSFSWNGQSRHRLLSVILPAYNAANTISAQLDALKIQEYNGDWDIVVVDNNSTDNTVEIVKSYQHLMPHLRFFNGVEKQSVSYAKSVGTQMAQGDAFLFCDADDIVAPGWVSAFAEGLERYHLVAGRVELHKLNEVAPPYTYAPRGSKHPHLGFLPFAMGCNFAVTREAFETVGGFSEELLRCQDVDLSWRLQLHGYELYDAPRAIVHYRYREGISEIWRQAVAFSKSEVLLYKRFASYGMPQPSGREVLSRYKALIKKTRHLPHMTKHGRVTWVRHVALCWGRLLGSLRYRTLYL